MSNKIYYLTLNTIGARTFVMPPGFEPSVEIHCWGAGGGGGRGAVTNTYGGYGVAGLGGGGGYAKSTVTINTGDRVTLQIGQPGSKGGYPTGGKGGVDSSYTLFRGGNSADAYDEDADTGAGGGGGGASWVAVNGTFVCVGAGGGGAGGLGDDGSGGNPGLPGGVTTNGLSTSYAGGDAPAGWSTGGGGGAGYPKGGRAGDSYGDDAPNPPAGSGGQNYGNVTSAGSGVFPGGRSVSLYPGNKIGEAGYPGYIVLVLTRKLNILNKNPDGSGDWVDIETMYYKLPTQTINVLDNPSSQTVAFTSIGSSSFRVPTNVTSLTIRASGGGGGGGGSDGGDSNHNLFGRGGSASNLQTLNLAVTPGDIINMSVGAGGGGAGPGYATAGSGGTTTISRNGVTVLSVAGGAGGLSRQSSAGPFPGELSTNGGSNGGNGSPTGYRSSGSNGQAGKVIISYTPDPQLITIVTGGWKQIQQAWVKISGLWKPLINQTIINLSKIFAVPKVVTYSSAGTYNFTVETGTSSLLVTATGAGGGGGGGHDPCGNSSHVGGLGGGGYVESQEITVVPGDVITVIVGSGGAGGAANGSGSNGNPTIIQLNSVEIFRADPGQGGRPGTGNGRGANGAGGTGGNGGASGLGDGSAIHTGGAGGAGRARISYSIFNIT